MMLMSGEIEINDAPNKLCEKHGVCYPVFFSDDTCPVCTNETLIDALKKENKSLTNAVIKLNKKILKISERLTTTQQMVDDMVDKLED